MRRMAQTLDVGPAVLLHTRLAYAALASGAAIYLEIILTIALVDEGIVSPVIILPTVLLAGAQYVLVRRPVKRLVADASGAPLRAGGGLISAFRVHLVLVAAFVGSLWVGAAGDEGRVVAPVTAAIVLGLLTVRPVVRLIVATPPVLRLIRAAPDPSVILDCFTADLRRSVQLKLQSVGGQRRRWLGPVLAAAAATALAAVAMALAMRLLGLANGPVGVVAGMVGVAVYYRTLRRAKLRATELRAADRRPPVLLLRQFSDDGLSSMRFTLGDRPTFEHLAAAALTRIGPTISIGKPGEPLQPLGAAREYLSDADWQRAVERLIREAGVVVFVLGGSRSLLWEFRTAIEARGTAGVLVLVPPIRDALELQQRWERFSAGVGDLVGGLGPMPAGRLLAVCFAGREPVLITCSQRPVRQAIAYRSEPDYRLALRLYAHLHGDALRSTESLRTWLAARFPLVTLDGGAPATVDAAASRRLRAFR